MWPGVVAHTCNLSLGGQGKEDHTLEASLGYVGRPCPKEKREKAGCPVKFVFQMPSKGVFTM